MLRRAGRLLPLLAAVLSLVLLGTGSFAVAHSKGDSASHKKRSDAQQRNTTAQSTGDDESSDEHGQRCDQSCRDNRYSAWDEEWLKMSIEGDRFEIQGGQLAQQKATRQIVRDLGARLVADHSKSLQDAVAVANELGIEVPTSPSPSQQWELRAVAQFKGAEFDRWYADLEVQDHIQDIQEAQDEIDKGCNEKIKQLAKDDLPVLQEHLKLAQEALAAVGGPADSSGH
jgi:putative membrane protein